MSVDWVGFSYAVLVSSGGILGYVKQGGLTDIHTYDCSVTSLAAGLLFGLLAALGAYMVSQNPKNIWLSLGTSGTLTVVMGLRFLNSGKFMPAGFMTVVSCLMLLRTLSGIIKRPHLF